MYKTSLLVAVTMATILTGHASRAQTKVSIQGQSVEITAKTANALVCREKWKQLNAGANKTAAQLQAIEYGSQYFQKVCKREMASKQ